MEAGNVITMSHKTVSVEKQIKYLKAAGVRRTFLTASHPKLDFTINLLRENNMICETLHGVFREPDGYKINDMHKPGEAGDIILGRLLENVSTCAKYNIPVLIVHFPDDGDNDLDTFENEYTAKRYKKLGEFARLSNVTLAFENTGDAIDCFDYIYKLVPDGKFCYDSGHEALFANGIKLLELYGDKLVALHLSDNHGADDDHIIPFDGCINFNEISEMLAKYNFMGTIMCEVPYKGEYEEKMSYEDFALRVHNAARRIALETEKI